MVKEVTFEQRPEGGRDKITGRASPAEGTASAKVPTWGRSSGVQGLVDALKSCGPRSGKAVRQQVVMGGRGMGGERLEPPTGARQTRGMGLI